MERTTQAAWSQTLLHPSGLEGPLHCPPHVVVVVVLGQPGRMRFKIHADVLCSETDLGMKIKVKLISAYCRFPQRLSAISSNSTICWQKMPPFCLGACSIYAACSIMNVDGHQNQL